MSSAASASDTGTIPSKTFREAVLSLNGRAFPDSRQTRSRSVVRPSAQELLARVEEVEQRQADIIKDQLRRNDVAVFMGEAIFKNATGWPSCPTKGLR